MTLSVPDFTIPADEEDRLKKLYRYGILDSIQENPFDDIAQLAVEIFDASAAMISFVDNDRVWYKSNTSSFPIKELPRKNSLCSLAILQEGVVVVHDIHSESSISIDPAIYYEYGIRFYAGAPIKTSEGYNIGAVCIIDTEPKEMSEKQLGMLRSLAAIVVEKLEQRVAIKNAHQVLDDLMERAIHDLKSPVTAIKALSQEIIRSIDDKESIADISNLISEASSHLLEGLNELKRLSRIEEGNFEICFETIVVQDELPKVIREYERQAHQKAQKIIYDIQTSKNIFGDRIRVREIIANLLSNAIKYSYPGSVICVTVKDKPGYVCIEVCDQGQGLLEEDMEKLFTKFAKLSALPTGKETSIGLGLHIVKMLVDLHGGKIWAESEGKDKGSKFFVELPAKLTFKNS